MTVRPRAAARAWEEVRQHAQQQHCWRGRIVSVVHDVVAKVGDVESLLVASHQELELGPREEPKPARRDDFVKSAEKGAGLRSNFHAELVVGHQMAEAHDVVRRNGLF